MLFLPPNQQRQSTEGGSHIFNTNGLKQPKETSASLQEEIILEQTALDRGQTDRISLTHDCDPDLQSPVSYGHGLLT